MTRAAVVRCLPWLLGLAAVSPSGAQRPAAAPPPGDARSQVLFQYSCENDLSRRQVTLFGNGTVRLREGLRDAQELYLDELGPRELESYVRRLEELQETELARSGDLLSSVHRSAEGDWIGECEIRLELDGAEPWVYRYPENEMSPIEVATLIHVAEQLADDTRLPAAVERVPADYEPRPGDVLRTAEGERFRVLRRTADGRGLELEGIDQPLRLFVDVDGLSEAFAAVEPRPGAPRPGGG